MPVDRLALLRDLQKRVRLLEDDVRQRLEGPDGADQRDSLVIEHRQTVEAERTSASWVEFRDEQVTQSAVAWVLATVFTRFCEDNGLVPDAWIAGSSEGSRLAAERQQAFLIAQPFLNDRDWLLAAFHHLAEYPALAALLRNDRNPLHRLSISADAAEDLIMFWRRVDDEGRLIHDLTDPGLSTRFLGDLYQDLSESARTRFALLQTPDFVEEFILDRTLRPALEDRQLENFRLIDPTCGSGHFLLGAFDRLLDRWSRQNPNMDIRTRVQRSLHSVYGVDLNPSAVAIAHFRLAVAALLACGLMRLRDAPAFTINLAVGDSLLYGPGEQTLREDQDLVDSPQQTGNLARLQKILQQDYDVVVGNPPYIAVRDAAMRATYRRRYPSCKGKYVLTIPFMERFFGLATRESATRPAGWVGQITSNAFMKREYGSELVENFLPRKDIRMIIDSESAWIPGHNTEGTPTVILVAREREPSTSTVRAILGKGRREGSSHQNGHGPYWTSMVQHFDTVGWEDDWISVVDLQRDTLRNHPWSLSGGQAPKLFAYINERTDTGALLDRAARIGVFGIPGADDSMVVPQGTVNRLNLETSFARRLVVGDEVRDYRVNDGDDCWFPYDVSHELRNFQDAPRWAQWFWPVRATLGNRKTFSGRSYFADQRPYYAWHQLPPDTEAHPWAISWAEVATHNHFVLIRQSTALKQTAPVIKMPRQASEEDFLHLLGILNASITCFWLRETCQKKGGDASQPWARTYQFNASNVAELPIPPASDTSYARQLEQLSRESSQELHALQTVQPDSTLLSQVAIRQRSRLRRMVALQEELDWRLYCDYGLVDDTYVFAGPELPDISPEDRAFAINMARSVQQGTLETKWFSESTHQYEMHTTTPSEWPEDYAALVNRRIRLMETDANISLLEGPEYKRRWATPRWETVVAQLAEHWLLEYFSSSTIWTDAARRPVVRSIAQLAAHVTSDADFMRVLELWLGRTSIELENELVALLSGQHVPFLAALRYSVTGLDKRNAWEECWNTQRLDDENSRRSAIQPPPSYAGADFLRPEYWRNRGKLDLPRERFISYPGAERGADRTLVLGWAGWNHAEQAQALASLSIARAQREGWEADRLTPLLAGLAELEPWLHQWHTEVDPRMGVSPAQAMTSTLDRELARLGLTRDDLLAWRPQAAVRGRRPRTTQEA